MTFSLARLRPYPAPWLGVKGQRLFSVGHLHMSICSTKDWGDCKANSPEERA